MIDATRHTTCRREDKELASDIPGTRAVMAREATGPQHYAVTQFDTAT